MGKSPDWVVGVGILASAIILATLITQISKSYDTVGTTQKQQCLDLGYKGVILARDGSYCVMTETHKL